MDANVELLLTQVKAAVNRHTRLIQDCRKRLKKADSRATAELIKREIETHAETLDVLKVQCKALKRGIVPDELKDSPTP